EVVIAREVQGSLFQGHWSLRRYKEPRPKPAIEAVCVPYHGGQRDKLRLDTDGFLGANEREQELEVRPSARVSDHLDFVDDYEADIPEHRWGGHREGCEPFVRQQGDVELSAHQRVVIVRDLSRGPYHSDAQ